jgi:hypothetical protein
LSHVLISFIACKNNIPGAKACLYGNAFKIKLLEASTAQKIIKKSHADVSIIELKEFF